MYVLVTYGSRHGGTAGIAHMVAAALREHDIRVEVRLASEAGDAIETADAVIVGSALYANRWDRHAHALVARHVKALRQRPVWFFSSGPLDDSASERVIPPVFEVSVLMDRVGALGHVTFGGRLDPDARGFPAHAMAKTRAGDWRRPDIIRAWADDVARALPTARPRPPVAVPGRSLPRAVEHALAGAGLLALSSRLIWPALQPPIALLVSALVAHHYFSARGARTPLATAAGFAGTTAALELAAAGDPSVLGGVARFWLPVIIVFLVTWAMGTIRAMVPARRAVP
jgi:menaquinone-dependent protoporphyrinogen oxidase